MRYVFKFPDIGEGIEEGKILEWFVRPGQAVKSGDSLVKVETDKVVADIPCPKDGTLVSTFGRVGEVIHVGNALVELELEGVEGAAAQAVAVEANTPKPKQKEQVEEKGFGVVGTLEVAGDNAVLGASEEGVPEDRSAAPSAQGEGKKVLATPVARAMAKERGIDIHLVQGSGPGGRITKEDVQRHQAGNASSSLSAKPSANTPMAQAAENETVFEPLTRIRKTIAARMTASKQNAAHMTLFWEVEVSELVALRSRHKGRLEKEGISLSYLPFVIKAVLSGLKAFPHFNSVLDLENDRIVVKKCYHIGLAVDGEAGLTVPVLRHADRLNVVEMAKAIHHMAEKARRRELTLDDLRDGTFTITNFGALGGSFGVPVLNYPEVAILGMGRIAEKPIVKNGQLAVGQILPLSLSVDHRLIDGGDAARFMRMLEERLTDPASLLFD